MKRHGIYLCLSVFMLCLALIAGCARGGASAASGGQQTSEGTEAAVAAAESQESTSEYRGRYLITKNGDPMIIIGKEGAVELFVQDGSEHMFDTLENGDLITVQLGLIRETYPAQADVFGAELVERGSISDIEQVTLDQLEEMGWIVQDKEQQQEQARQLLYVGDRLYIGTGRPAAPSCGTADGRVKAVLKPEEIPGEDGQANFGSVGTGYIYLDEGAMAVPLEADSSGNQVENTYQLFLSDDTVDYNGCFFKKADISQDTIEWLDFYNSLPEDGQRSISMVPPDLIDRQQAPGDSAVEETK